MRFNIINRGRAHKVNWGSYFDRHGSGARRIREFSYLMRITPQVYTRAELKREIISGSTPRNSGFTLESTTRAQKPSSVSSKHKTQLLDAGCLNAQSDPSHPPVSLIYINYSIKRPYKHHFHVVCSISDILRMQKSVTIFF